MNTLGRAIIAWAVLAFCPLTASGSLFLDPVAPLIRLEGETPGVGVFDGHAVDFVSNRPTFDAFLNSNTDPITEIYAPSGMDLVDDITIPYDAYVRMYFLDEDAGFSNSLGFVENGNYDLNDIANQNSLVFPQVIDITDPLGPPFDRIDANDYVEMGTLSAGTDLDFFVIQDGADALPDDGITEPVFWSEASLNNDEIQHFLMTEFQLGGDLYYLIAYEDLNTNTNSNNNPNSINPLDYPIDFTDGQVVLQVVQVPEPSTYLILGSCLMVVMVLQRRRKKQAC